MVQSGRNSNSPQILCMSLLPASIKRIRSKTTKKRWRHHFPHYKSMGAFCCHENQRFNPICPKTLGSLSPTPVMLHIKFDQNLPTAFRLRIFKFKSVNVDGGFLLPWTPVLIQSASKHYAFVCVEVLRPSQQLRSCRAGQLHINTVPGQA